MNEADLQSLRHPPSLRNVGGRRRKDASAGADDAEYNSVEAGAYDVDHQKINPQPASTENTTTDDPISGNKEKAKQLSDKYQAIEREYDGIPIPPWREQLTVRAIVVSIILGTIFSIITHRLNLTVGVIPSLNVSAGLLGFVFMTGYTKIARMFGITTKPFTRQENTVIQTCVVSCYGIAFSGGYGSYILGMSQFAYEKMGTTLPGNDAQDVKNPQLGWLFGFTFTITLVGIFSIVILRKTMIINYKLIYPSGTATGILINSFHTPQGSQVAKRQIKYVGKYFTLSFLWSFFKWFFSGLADACGYDSYPSLGLKAFENSFYFDFNMTYVGAGMICPHIVNCSILFGAIISWGLMWPLIKNHAGDWYPATAVGSDFRGLFGYKVFVSVALILGDGLYHFVKITGYTIWMLFINFRNRMTLPSHAQGEADDLMSYDEKRRNEIFMKDSVPYKVAVVCYVLLAINSIIVVPHIFPSVKFYYVMCAYLIGPVFAFCNAYGMGLTDWSLASNYGKILLFVFAAWAGKGGGGIIAGLAACGVMMTVVATAADLMQDFKTGYLTLSSPRSMFFSQLIGALMGCVIAPSTFWLFWKAFDIGQPGSLYKAPYAVIYRTMAWVGVEGFGALPTHCLQLCAGWFAFAILVNFIRDMVPKKVSNYIPIPMAMAIPFYLGAYFAIDMFIGTCIVFIWELTNKRKADTYTPGVASGLICGDGVWTIPAAILNFAKVNPPLCMTFFRSRTADALGYPIL